MHKYKMLICYDKVMLSLAKNRNFLAILLFAFLTLLFFYQVFLGKIPIPADALVGTYLPWLDYKWGSTVGVPVKNPIISDVFSQYYPWRELVINTFRQGFVPLWNPYSFSGTPLLADWQSVVFYPLNILMLVMGNIRGWTAIIMLQPFLSMVFTYLYLQEIKLRQPAAILGAITYAFSGFLMIFLEYNSPAQTAIWLPLILFLIEKFLRQQKTFWLSGISLAIFILLSAGNFQVSFYSLTISALYLLGRLVFVHGITKTALKVFWKGIAFYLIGLGLAAIQILPTFELFQNSIRQTDKNIIMYNFGLLPLQNIVTFFAPDFFGNPATGNFWGFIYHETTGYFGIISIPLIITAIFKRHNFITTFFTSVFIISLFLVFDNPVGRLIYQLHVPLLSTSYASRALFLVDFSAAILTAFGLNNLLASRKLTLRSAFGAWIITLSITIAIALAVTILKKPLTFLSSEDIAHLSVALKNLILPLGLISFLLLGIRFISSSKLLIPLILVLAIFDLFRFGLKYNPFVPNSYLFPETPTLEFLQKNMGNFRVEREQSETLPPNTWMSYKLMSPSGYDPLYSKQYATFYNVYNGNPTKNTFTRYAELSGYNSPILDLAGVKYLVVAKRKSNGSIDKQGSISAKFSKPKFKEVFTDQSNIVLENTNVLPRVKIFGDFDIETDYQEALTKIHEGYDFSKKVILDNKPTQSSYNISPTDQAKIVSYLPNEVDIKTQTKNGGILMLTDTYYPGWKVYVNDKPQKLIVADGIFRAVEIETGESLIQFKFEPDSFKYGLWISVVSFIILGTFTLASVLRHKESNITFS